MQVPFIIAILVTIGWLAITRRVSLLTMAVATVLIGYVFGHAFWHVDFGPLPLTLDRLMVGLIVAVGAFLYWNAELKWPRLTLTDWALAGTLVWLTLSAAFSNIGSGADLPTSPLFRLLFSFWVPALLYIAVRCSRATTQSTTTLLAALTVLGCYLAVTACAESAGQWWAVFPRYLADPELGTHYGRARGPALNSVSLGIYLSIACWATWLLRSRVSRGWQITLMVGMAVMVFAVFLTYTRSAWLGLALSGMVMLIAQTPRNFRLSVALSSLVLGVIAVASSWTYVMNLQREDSGQVSHHSVRQRTAFAHVSWQMLKDEPLLGVGFGRFYDKKLPYLADRSQSFELESLRYLHHHNTFLSLLVETGIIGLACYLALLAGWIRAGWRMAFAAGSSLATRQMGQLLLATLAVYLPSAFFHDLSHIFQDQWLLFLIVGVCVTASERTATATRSMLTARTDSVGQSELHYIWGAT
ncbi:MAG: O-antigen ligase family protein [Aeoliella sp.]